MSILSEPQIEGSVCPVCKEGPLGYCPPNEPWSNEHLICEKCFSTFGIIKNEVNSETIS